MKTRYSGLKGVLPDSRIRDLIADGAIMHADANNVGSSSLDSSLAGEAFLVSGSARPVEGQTVRDLIKKLRPSVFSIHDTLKPGQVYIMRLNEKISLPSSVYGYANPKSTTGRDDVHVRLLADGVGAYDSIPRGYKGELWLEVKPMSFFCRAQCGLPLNQLRFFTADTRIKSPKELVNMQETEGHIVFRRDGTPITLDEKSSPDGSVMLTIYMEPDSIGYEAKGTHEVLDLSAKGGLDPKKFFIPKETTDGLLYLQKDRFYILSTDERVRVPVNYACEMRPIDDRFGEIRVHYAGYIDDGFEGPITLEVRTQEDTYLQPGQPIARIVYEKMALPADKPYTVKESGYSNQPGPKLSKHFNVV